VNKEVERKWRVLRAPESLGAGAALRQGYITEAGGTEVRLRAKGGGYKLTVKRGRGLSRTEVEVSLSQEQFEALWPLTDGQRIEKVRYNIPHGPYTIEFDVFSGALEGLLVAEVEFAGEEEARAYVAPDWFGEDLTGRQGWSNGDLARGGLPAE